MGMEARAMNIENMLEAISLSKTYDKHVEGKVIKEIPVLKGLDFEVKKGEFLGVMGKSGCGKTTLLKILGMIHKQSEGTLKFMGKETDSMHPDELADIRRKQIGFVFQDFYLMDSLSVKENIMLPMILNKEKSEIMIRKTRALAEHFEIEALLEKNPYELSGGEKQRTAICRALINDPELVLADEPTGNLDTKSGGIVIAALKRINREYKKTVLMVTHDPKIASDCEKIILLKDGKIVEELKKTGDKEKFYHLILQKMDNL
jgi:ABC-type lipoprotein export system ATPase subunit